MNQSNKALRDSLAVDRYGSRYIDLTETQQLTVNRYIALVTNHIKVALLAAAVPSDTTPAGEPEYVPLTVVHQLLEEVSK